MRVQTERIGAARPRNRAAGDSLSVSRQSLWGAFAALGLAAAALFAGPERWAAAQEQPRSASAGPIVLRNCRIKAVQTARLATDRPGVLAVVDPKEGDLVKEGQPVARLMDDVPQANWEVAKLVAKDEIEIKYATKLNAVDALEYAKSVEANNKAPGTISEIELRRLKLAEQRSALQIEKAKHDMDVNDMKAKQAEVELKTYRILAPFDGFVSQVLKYRGEAVKQGDTILEMVNTDMVHVEGVVGDRDIWRVKRGSPVTVALDIKGAELDVERQVFRGKIGFVDAVANVGETRVWAEVPNPGNVLRPGFSAIMTILPGAPEEKNASTRRPRAVPVGSKVAGRQDLRTP
jgi:multidrug efflux pump subunit AcrA (membrane-fusion protein)